MNVLLRGGGERESIALSIKMLDKEDDEVVVSDEGEEDLIIRESDDDDSDEGEKEIEEKMKISVWDDKPKRKEMKNDRKDGKSTVEIPLHAPSAIDCCNHFFSNDLRS